MSTSRKFHVFPQASLIVEDAHFALVTNRSRTRIVHKTRLYQTQDSAIYAAKRWAKKSNSKKAQSLNVEDQK